MRAIPQNLGAGTLRIVASVTIPFAVCLAVDTSGASAHYSCAYSTGSSVNEHNWQSQIPVGPVNAVESPVPGIIGAATADIEFIQSSLKITSSALARYIGVSRQALYDWKSGGRIKIENAFKLESLRAASEVIASSGQSIPEIQLRRKLPGGRSLLDSIASGSDGASVARSLLGMLRDEAAQRESLRTRFSGRKPVFEDSNVAGIGMVPLREEG